MDLFDFERLPILLGGQLKELLVGIETPTEELLVKCVWILMQEEPRSLRFAIDQARHLFEKTMLEVELIDSSTIANEQQLGHSEEHAHLETEIVGSSFLARVGAVHAIENLNRNYKRHQVFMHAPNLAEESLDMMKDSFLDFYRAMRLVGMDLARANEGAAKVNAYRAIAGLGLELEALVVRSEQLEREQQEVRTQIAAAGGNPSVEDLNAETDRAEYRLGVVNNERVIIYSVEEHEALRQKEAQLERELKRSRQQIGAIESVNKAVAANLTDEEVLDIMLRTDSLKLVAQRWKEVSKAKAKLQKSFEAGLSAEELKARLRREGRFYFTRDIIEEVQKRTGVPYTTDDVVYRLDQMVKQKVIPNKKAGRHWELTYHDFEIACEYLSLLARKKARRQRRNST